MKKLRRLLTAASILVLAISVQNLQPARADASFKGKQIRLLIGFSPAGFGYDTYGRLLAKYLPRHLPGTPQVVPENQPGAGSLSLMNQIYNTAPRDGTNIALVGRGAAMDPILNGAKSNAKFDATKFNWIGSMNNEVAGFFVTDTAPAKSLKDILSGTPMQVGSTGAGGDPQVFASILNGVLGTHLKIVAGYPGINEILLAMDRGELDGLLGYSWGVARMGSADDLRKGKLKLVMQLALKKHPDLPDVPLVTDLVPDGDKKRILEMIFSRQAMGRPIVAPPGLPDETVAMLRRGFADTMKDPDFIEEAKKLSLEISFVSGEEVQALVQKVYAFPPSVLDKARVAANTQ